MTGDKVPHFRRGRATVIGSDPFVRRTLGLLGLLAIAASLYLVVPLYGFALTSYYQLVASGSLLIALLGVAHHRPVRRAGWLLVLGGFGCWVMADLTVSIEQHLWHGSVYPAPSDALYLVGYGVLAAGAFVMVRTRRAGRDITALLDAVIIAAGAGVVASVFVIAPLASASDLTSFGKVVGSAYPIGDILLIAVVVRMWASPGAQTPSYRLMVSALGLTLVADIIWNAHLIATGSVVSGWSDLLWLGSYVVIAAAACLPSMTTLAELAPARADTGSSRRRVLVLACGIMLPAVTLLLDGATGGGVLWPVIGVGALLISVLVLVRMGRILRTVEVQAVQLAALARSDPLTGAPNRRTWDYELSRACATSLEHGTPLCVAMMDIDHFKAFNDTYGHQAGDRLLREAVAIWTERLVAGSLLARYGGEEFAVLLPGLTLAEAHACIEDLRARTPHGQTFSAGVSTWDSLTEPAHVVASADQALYEAKRTGRDRVLSYGGVAFDTTLPPALPRFSIVLQPIVEVATGRIVGHEALSRFEDRANDPRAVFRLAHLDGYGDLLEAATIIAALALSDRPEGQALYVNASARALTSTRFWLRMPERLDSVMVELTEDTEHIDSDTLADAVARLRARGASIALDDLGAGVGEFHRMAALCPDVVKADRSLVHGCASQPGQSAVLRGLVTYANALGTLVCAEGVEDWADLDHLEELGVTLAQGFLLGRPDPEWRAELSVTTPSHTGL
jgi:diguanylate cyclase (GGDEF)-like protein